MATLVDTIEGRWAAIENQRAALTDEYKKLRISLPPRWGTVAEIYMVDSRGHDRLDPHQPNRIGAGDDPALYDGCAVHLDGNRVLTRNEAVSLARQILAKLERA